MYDYQGKLRRSDVLKKKFHYGNMELLVVDRVHPYYRKNCRARIVLAPNGRLIPVHTTRFMRIENIITKTFAALDHYSTSGIDLEKHYAVEVEECEN